GAIEDDLNAAYLPHIGQSEPAAYTHRRPAAAHQIGELDIELSQHATPPQGRPRPVRPRPQGHA
ncbi:hypothetical protein PUR71_00470, partial [Streptomyces sp. SP17BM10]|uniref:hypothetical protein n=1 Tax=Streptomyces sp. SP17BM10 TaxID=3002530 RepID=UPI002E7833A4